VAIKLDSRLVEKRRAFFHIDDDDLARLARLKPLAEKHQEAIIEDFYELLLAHDETRAFLKDAATIARVKASQKQYFLGLFSGRCDLAYATDRLRVGSAHERIGLPPTWYLGAYNHYLELFFRRIAEELPEEEARKSYRALEKLVFFDAALAIDTYVDASVENVRRHQAAIRELSTPVIKIHDRVLLLPIIGTMDTQRAQQIMETVLSRVVEEQAKIIILDIAGVAVVDTDVADNLLKTTAAVRLLGAQTVLTGISAQVARTVVQLGVDISSMTTRSNLSDGIKYALGAVGLEISERRE
jgi:rsbT co-antagonist protein RsbR